MPHTRVLVVVQGIVPSTTIVISQIFADMQKKGDLSWSLVREDQVQETHLDEVDVVVFQRNCRPNILPILAAVRKRSLPLIYDLDDNFLAIPPTNPVGRYYALPQVRATVVRLLQEADVVKVGSRRLAAEVAPLARRVVVHPYAIDTTNMQHPQEKADGRIVIGYAGTINHGDDLALVRQPLQDILDKYGSRLHVEFLGCQQEQLAGRPEVTYYPFIPNYAEYLAFLQQHSWDIGIAPLHDTLANRCKTDNKFREYGACGMAGVYSAIEPYTDTVVHRRTGLLVENTDAAWYAALRELVDDADLRAQIGRQAQAYVQEKHSLAVVGECWRRLFAELLGRVTRDGD